MPIATISPVSGEKPSPSLAAFISSSDSANFSKYSFDISSRESKSFPTVSISMTSFLDIEGFNMFRGKDAMGFAIKPLGTNPCK